MSRLFARLLAVDLRIAVGAFVFCVFAFSLAIVPESVHAQGAVGPGTGGSGGASGQGARTRNGWGWYNYSVDGNPSPQGFKDGQNWGSVSNTCRASGADRVIAFIILTQAGTDAGRGMVYGDYSSSTYPENMRGHITGGGNWISTDTARNLFYSLDPSIRGGYAFGAGSGSNNVAWFCYSNRTHWTASSYTGIKKANNTGVNSDSGWTTSDITVRPTETIYWKHTLTAHDARIDTPVRWWVEISGYSIGGTYGNTINGTNGIGTFLRLGQYPGGNASYMLRTAYDSDLGKRLCQNIAWSPYSWNNGGTGRSNAVCASVPYNYNLVPVVTGASNRVTEGSNIQVSPAVRNTGQTLSETAEWQLVTFNVPPNQSLPVTNTGTRSPISYYGYSARPVETGSRTFPVNSGTGTSVAAASRKVPSVDVGTRVCWALAVKPFDHNDANNNVWRYGTPYCPVVSKSPLVQIRGGDLIVGRAGTSQVTTSTKDLDGKIYGSWGEYGVIASGTINAMASSAGYAGGTTKNLCGVSLLTLSNKPTATDSCNGNLGRYQYGGAMPAVGSRFLVTSSSPKLSSTRDLAITDLTSRAISTNQGATISLSGGAVGKDNWYVINAPNATVTIKGDIKYDSGTLTSVASIPQMVIIAKNIIIAESVKQVDSWLIATGTGADGYINTCGSVVGVSDLTSEKCKEPLNVNGPVVANHLYLRRTYGAGAGAAASGVPGETFNLRPDAYLWANNLQNSAGKVRTVKTTELPPRY